MPWHVYEAQHLMLVGEATNKDLALDFLRPMGLYPIHSSNNLPLVTVGCIKYIDGAAGAYDEFYISFWATKSPPISR